MICVLDYTPWPPAGSHERGATPLGAILSMMPEHLNDGWRTTVVDVPAASGALRTPTPTPSPLTIDSSSRQASMLLQLNLIESEEALTTWAG